MRLSIIFGIVYIMVIVLSMSTIAKAVEFNDITPEEKQTFDKILEPILKVYNLVKYVATVLAALFLLFAGITYITSGSDPKKRDEAKSIGTYVIFGLAVIWATPFIVNFLV